MVYRSLTNQVLVLDLEGSRRKGRLEPEETMLITIPRLRKFPAERDIFLINRGRRVAGGICLSTNNPWHSRGHKDYTTVRVLIKGVY